MSLQRDFKGSWCLNGEKISVVEFSICASHRIYNKMGTNSAKKDLRKAKKSKMDKKTKDTFAKLLSVDKHLPSQREENYTTSFPLPPISRGINRKSAAQTGQFKIPSPFSL